MTKTKSFSKALLAANSIHGTEIKTDDHNCDISLRFCFVFCVRQSDQNNMPRIDHGLFTQMTVQSLINTEEICFTVTKKAPSTLVRFTKKFTGKLIRC